MFRIAHPPKAGGGAIFGRNGRQLRGGYGRVGQRGYRISTQEFENLQRAVEAYKTLSEQESASAIQPE